MSLSEFKALHSGHSVHYWIKWNETEALRMRLKLILSSNLSTEFNVVVNYKGKLCNYLKYNHIYT